MSKNHIVIVACEQSGDNYGALLSRELRELMPDVSISGIGGPAMAQAGADLLENMIEHSATGLVEVLTSARFFLKTMKRVVQHAKDIKARAVIMIDSPDFNLRIAPKLKAASIPTAYYVSPQLWAWRSGRVKQIERYVDRMMVIFPFEVDWYRERGVDAVFVGHPMLDLFDLASIRDAGEALHGKLCNEGEKLVGILPGSRRNEISRLLPMFLDAALMMSQQQSGLRFVVGCARWLNESRIGEMLAPYDKLNITALHNRTHEVMAASDVLMACSGTATLEAALIGTPLVMAYKLSPLTRVIAELLVSRQQFFCMPNRILGEKVAPELIPGNVNAELVAQHTLRLLGDDGVRAHEQFLKLESLLGGKGASRRAALEVKNLIEG